MATPWMDIGRIAGGYLWSRYGNRKPKLPKDKGVVKRTGKTRSHGETQYNAFMQANPAMPLQPFKKAKPLSGPSLRAAQKLRESSTRTEEEYERKRKTKMGKYAPGTLGRRYKPKFKTVPVSARTSRVKYIDHETRSANGAIYSAFNDVGPEDHFLRCLAEAILLHYSHRAGDHRVHLQGTPVGPNDTADATTDAEISFATWSRMDFVFRRASPAGTSANENPVINTVRHYEYVGSSVSKVSWPNMVADLTNRIKEAAQIGSTLASVMVFRSADGGALQHLQSGAPDHQELCVIHDPEAGSHEFKFNAVARYKIQNTTVADSTTHSDLKDNIHSNPLDGLVYRFRNKVPVWRPGYILTKGTDDTLNDLEDCTTTEVSGVKFVDLKSADPTTFVAPPPAPYTLFTNSAGRSKIRIKPGEHRVLKLSENFNGSINAFIKRYVAVQPSSGRRTAPPGGTCLMIGLKPMFRTGLNEDLEIQTECDRYLAGLVRKRALTSNPITHVVS